MNFLSFQKLMSVFREHTVAMLMQSVQIPLVRTTVPVDLDIMETEAAAKVGVSLTVRECVLGLLEF